MGLTEEQIELIMSHLNQKIGILKVSKSMKQA